MSRFRQSVLAPVAVGVVLALGGVSVMAADSASAAAPTTTKSSGELVTTYSAFAGSSANSKALVEGLRSGTPITLQGGTAASTSGAAATGATTFKPATTKLGTGEVNIALALAQAELSKLGISNPTPAQLQAALNGGVVTTAKGSTTLPGVLQLRSEGKGWGVVAKSVGVKLGEVVSDSKKSEKAESVQQAARSEKAEKAEKVAKIERAERVERVERVERPERIERPRK